MGIPTDHKEGMVPQDMAHYIACPLIEILG